MVRRVRLAFSSMRRASRSVEGEVPCRYLLRLYPPGGSGQPVWDLVFDQPAGWPEPQGVTIARMRLAPGQKDGESLQVPPCFWWSKVMAARKGSRRKQVLDINQDKVLHAFLQKCQPCAHLLDPRAQQVGIDLCLLLHSPEAEQMLAEQGHVWLRMSRLHVAQPRFHTVDFAHEIGMDGMDQLLAGATFI